MEISFKLAYNDSTSLPFYRRRVTRLTLQPSVGKHERKIRIHVDGAF
jgi:hypothetical protein